MLIARLRHPLVITLHSTLVMTRTLMLMAVVNELPNLLQQLGMNYDR